VASLIQLYTGLNYEGLGLLATIQRALIESMDRARADDLAALRGSGAERWASMKNI
jgi:dihydroorotate dehydrogenase